MRTRKDLEELERLSLAPYATTSQHSLGRMYPENEHPYRTAFQRDRDRIIHTRAFRRLEYKTQVFVNHEGDYYRTRLTHTLEVAQIARTIARTLGVNENLTEAICLAHDLGHTPFGHSGQDAMAELMQNHGGFEHNKQSFRIVTLLERPYPQFTGLNLTYELLEGITKHASEYDMPDGSLFIKHGYPSIEAQIANFADEIAYNNHDIDDGLKSGLLKMDELQQVQLWCESFEPIKKSNASLSDKQIRRMAVKTIIDRLVSDLLEHTSSQISVQKIGTLKDVRQYGKNLVGFSKTIQAQNAELKRFLFVKLYRHEHVEKMAERGQTVIRTLFEAYTSDFNRVPSGFKKDYGHNEAVERIVCDYIAGMTDRFALQAYAALKTAGFT